MRSDNISLIYILKDIKISSISYNNFLMDILVYFGFGRNASIDQIF